MTVQDTAKGAPPEMSPAKRALLEARLWGLHRPTTITPRPRTGPIPLTSDQERFWFLDRLGQGGRAYNIDAGLRLEGGIDESAMEKAIGEIVRRHETLRTTIHEVDGVPVQVVAPVQPYTLPIEDLSALSAEAREERVREAFLENAGHLFDLTTGPLFFARLLRLGDAGHALLLCMHHIVGDGWSSRILYRELWALYDAYRQGDASPLPELPVQYADYAIWQREQLQSDAGRRHLAYWKERLSGAPELMELPADHPRPPVPSFQGGTVPVNVRVEVLDRLRDVARAEGATLYMVVLAAFKVLLARYSGGDDVVVGTPVAGRSRREVEDLIGLFVNELVLRTDLSGDPTFRELVGRVRETVLGAYEHQDVPFEAVVDEVRPQRSLSHSTLFQVIFQLDNAEMLPTQEGVGVREIDAERGTTKLDLTLGLDAHAGGITGVLDYSTDLFEAGTARRMVEHLERLLDQASRHPDQRVSRLELMGQADRARVLEWNRTTARYPADRCIHQLFEAQARRTPDAVAVVGGGGETVSYRRLDEDANRLAHHLRAMGVGPEVRVGLLLERGPDMMTALLGVMKAGGAYVPLDRAYPAERLAYMLDDARVAVLVTQSSLRDAAAAPAGARVLCMDTERAALAARPATAPESGVGSENLAYVIYTSGSTGRPKGVAMHHRGVSNYIHWGIRYYGADRGAGAPVFSSIAVDLTVTNLLPLFAGLPVHLLPDEQPVEALAAVLREKPGFGLIKITPIHLSLLTPLLTPEQAGGAAHTLVIGADNLVAEPTLFWQDHAPGVRLMNEYGPTETVVGCSAYVLPNGRHRAGPVPVGRPIQNLRFYVLDAHLQPVPVGLPGELYIGGAGVARGYLGRPGLSAAVFVPDPFAEPGARMYRTGDRARWLQDGNLLFLGRRDSQVKVRGYRVELGEIEAVLRRHPGVRDCLVTVREDRPGDRRLVAYVVGDAAAPALREHLLAALPEYMVPAAFVPLAALPQTSTGKIDPRTLPAPDYAAGAAAADAEAPRGEVEVALAEIWEEMLDVEGVGATQNFFELGGNSLLALPLFARIRQRLECELPLATLYAGPTVREMARAVEAQRRDRAALDASPLVPLHAAGTLPPLFGVHPADRRVLVYGNLVRHLGGDQPFYGLQDTGDDLSRPVPVLAAEYVRAVRQVQPHGPYYLAGWSFGGFVALEMAAQLEAQGEAVAFVGLMDTMAPELARTPVDDDSDLELVVGLAEDVAAQMGGAVAIPRDALKGLDHHAQLRFAVNALHAAGAAPPAFDAAALGEHFDAIRARETSVASYHPSPFSGTLTLFRAVGVPPEYAPLFARLDPEERRTLGWSRVSPRPVRVHRVPGEHVTMSAEPHVRELADRVREALAAARAAAGPWPPEARPHGE